MVRKQMSIPHRFCCTHRSGQLFAETGKSKINREIFVHIISCIDDPDCSEPLENKKMINPHNKQQLLKSVQLILSEVDRLHREIERMRNDISALRMVYKSLDMPQEGSKELEHIQNVILKADSFWWDCRTNICRLEDTVKDSMIKE